MSVVRERCEPGGPFRRQAARAIAGAWGAAGANLSAALQEQLGVDVLPAVAVVVDADACSIDGRPIETKQEWLTLARAGDLGRVEGAFAIGWIDADGGVSIARDPIGHRTLYYAEASGTLVFASTLRALLDVGAAERRICLRAVAAYLAYAYVPSQATTVEGIYEVLPGEQVSFRERLVRRRYWDLPVAPQRAESEGALRAALRHTLEDRVAACVPDGAPVAASLSGGIDSSLVVALAARRSCGPVRTFSITFGAAYRDELRWSSLVHEHVATAHTIVELTPAAIAAHLDDTMACLDKPNGDPLTVPNALLFRSMAAASSVALNGEGGDPCFGGPKNLPMLLSALYDGGDARADYLRAHLKCFDELADMLTPDALSAACTPALEDDLTSWFEDERREGLVPRLMAINVRFKGGHHILPKVDALSAPFGVMARSPLFARAVVEAAAAIPAPLKLRGSEEKYLLKQAVADLLPEAILARPKSGMMVPVEGWFQGPLLPQARERILDGLAPKGFFRRDYLERLVAGTLGGLRPRRGVKIWLLVALEAHLRTHDLTRAG